MKITCRCTHPGGSKGYQLSTNITCKECGRNVEVSNVRRENPDNYDEATFFLGKLYFNDYNMEDDEASMTVRRLK